MEKSAPLLITVRVFMGLTSHRIEMKPSIDAATSNVAMPVVMRLVGKGFVSRVEPVSLLVSFRQRGNVAKPAIARRSSMMQATLLESVGLFAPRTW